MIYVLLVIYLIWLFIPARPAGRKRNKKTRAGPDPIKQAREREKLLEQREKARERVRKQSAAKNSAAVKARQYELLVKEYADYIRSLKTELNDSNISITRYNQIQKEILRSQEKITKYGNDANKSFFESQ
jgi:aromatic ring hydroxylase